jgi:hypothetical protein
VETIRKAKGPVKQVLCEYGRTPEGDVYLLYRLSPAAVCGGVLTLPAAAGSQGEGRFAILSDDGSELGTLVSKNGCVWGLGPALRQRRAAAGDYLLIVLDPGGRKARIRVGDRSIAAAVTGGEKSWVARADRGGEHGE